MRERGIQRDRLKREGEDGTLRKRDCVERDVKREMGHVERKGVER